MDRREDGISRSAYEWNSYPGLALVLYIVVAKKSN